MEKVSKSDYVILFEESCKKLGYDSSSVVPELSMLPIQHRKATQSFLVLLIIVEAANEGHVFDWNNYDEYKWFPWFDMETTEENPSGFRFDGSVYVCVDSVSPAALGLL